METTTMNDEFTAGKAKHGADLLLDVARQKAAAAKIDPGRDSSAEAVAKARREAWSRTPSQGS
jgi:hypothetical protein